MSCVSNSRSGACQGPGKLGEIPMTAVGGLDIHRNQLTTDYPGTVTGEVKRGQVAPADRAHLLALLGRFRRPRRRRVRPGGARRVAVRRRGTAESTR